MARWRDRIVGWLEGRGAPSKPALPGEATGAREPATRPVYLHIGLDFGTRFTKPCVRNIGLERSSVVVFGSAGQAVGDAGASALLVSAVLVRDGRVQAGLTEAEWEELKPGAYRGDRVVDYLKMRVAALDDSGLVVPGWQRTDQGAVRDEAELEALTVFYLARVIARCRKRTSEVQREWFLNRSPRWSTSLGIPAAHSQSAIDARFERLVRRAEAWARCGVSPEMRVEEVREAVGALPAGNGAGGVDVCPEIAAAVEAFVRSRAAVDGVYLYFDVGAGTLDGNSFRLYRPPGQRRQVNIYSTYVVPLGVAALADTLASTLSLVSSHALELLAAPEPPPAWATNALQSQRAEAQRATAKVILAGKRKEPDRWRRELYDVARSHAPTSTCLEVIPAFVGGGGWQSWLYRRDIIEGTYEHLKNVNVLPWRVVELPVPEDLEFLSLPKTAFQRLAVAYGLSIPPAERSLLALPDDIDDLWPPKPRAPRHPPVPPYEDSKEVLQ